MNTYLLVLYLRLKGFERNLSLYIFNTMLYLLFLYEKYG